MKLSERLKAFRSDSPGEWAMDHFVRQAKQLEDAIIQTIEDNPHLADGENCTLIRLKRAIGYE